MSDLGRSIDDAIPEFGLGLGAALARALEADGAAEVAELFPDLPGVQAARRGRPKGAVHKATRDAAEFIASQKLNPLIFLNLVMQGAYGGKLETRIAAANAILPYVYKRKPQDVNVSNRAFVLVQNFDGGHAGLGGEIAALLNSNEINGLAVESAVDVNAQDVNADIQSVEIAQQSSELASDPCADAEGVRA
jgi:hypothetical protein